MEDERDSKGGRASANLAVLHRFDGKKKWAKRSNTCNDRAETSKDWQWSTSRRPVQSRIIKSMVIAEVRATAQSVM